MTAKRTKKKRNTVPITPSVLRWAMDEAGFTVEALAKKAKASTASIRAWLSEEEQPGLTEFRKLAAALARIPSVFLLPEPPSVSTTPAVEFRHPPDSRASLNPTERRYVREAGRIQEAVAWLMRELGETPSDLPQVRVGSNVGDVAADTRKRLTGSLNGSFGSRWRDEFQAFREWRDLLEESHILVFVLPLGKESCRGFSLWDDYAPLITVNSAWRHSARIFTLFHEYGHLLTRTSSACVEDSPRRAMRANEPWDVAERWCERFSAAFLMPKEAVLSFLHDTLDWPQHRPANLAATTRVANHFKVSLRAAALRLIELEAAEWALYQEMPSTADAKGKGGGSGEPRDRGDMRRAQYGERTVNLFVRALRNDVLGRTDVLEYLDVTDAHLERFERVG